MFLHMTARLRGAVCSAPVTTFGLVHGAWHGDWCWDRLVPELERRGHTAIAPDLPIEDASAAHAEYAAAVVDALEGADGADDVVLVGHSMGSLVIPLVADARPVRGMVFLCAVPLVPGVTVGLDFSNMVSDEVASAVHFRDDAGRDVFDNATARRAFYHDCDDTLASWAVARLRPQCMRPFTEVSPLRAWPEGVPSEVVLTADDRALNTAWAAEAAQSWLGHPPRMLPGSHSPFLSHPAELADVLVEVNDSFS
jgi:pimeloyl-ACP methyl ester carboxylesterase